MLSNYDDAVKVKCQHPGGEITNVCFGENDDFEAEVDRGSIILVDPNIDMEMEVKKKFLAEKGQAQDPDFIWQPIYRPNKNTRQQLKDEFKALNDLEELERRGREYEIDQAAKHQVEKVVKAATAEANQ